MTGWVPVFDQSFQRVPVSRLHEMYAAGFRVMAGYAGGGSLSKRLTGLEIHTWLGLGPDTGVAALFEIKGTEPIDNPASGSAHAREARDAWHALGYPDHCTISPAVDENVTVAEARTALATYFRNWKAADTCKPLAYVEMDAGAVLFALNLTVGTFTPAAYGWDASGTLVTPANAPAHVLWTQERNGRALDGGDVDTGHIRTSTPVWWKTPTSPTGEDMAFTLDEIATAVVDKLKADPSYVTLDKIATAVVDKLKADPSYVDLTWRAKAIADGADTYAAGSMKGQAVGLTKLIKSTSVTDIEVDASAAADAVVDELAARLKVKPAS